MIARGPKSNFICDNIPAKAILFFFDWAEVNSTWLITSELAKQRARKELFAFVIYNKTNYSRSQHRIHLNLLWEFSVDMFCSSSWSHTNLSHQSSNTHTLGPDSTRVQSDAHSVYWDVSFPSFLLKLAIKSCFHDFIPNNNANVLLMFLCYYFVRISLKVAGLTQTAMRRLSCSRWHLWCQTVICRLTLRADNCLLCAIW